MLEFSKPKYKESAVFVDFFGWFEDSESVYLAMEYIPLGDLEENVQALGGSLKETEVRDITIQVLDGLKIMHLESFAHRDLKPKVCSSISVVMWLTVHRMFWCAKEHLVGGSNLQTLDYLSAKQTRQDIGLRQAHLHTWHQRY
jgi:hypothetical protein